MWIDPNIYIYIYAPPSIHNRVLHATPGKNGELYLCIYTYMRRPAYTNWVLHATLGNEGDICIYIYMYIYICAARHTQIGCYMPRLAMRVLYAPTPAYRVFKAPAAAQSVRGYSKRPSLPIAPEAVQSVRGLSMRLSLLKAHCVLGPDLYSLQVNWTLLCIYMRRLVYAIRVLHATPGKEGAICIYIYVYICIYVYACIYIIC